MKLQKAPRTPFQIYTFKYLYAILCLCIFSSSASFAGDEKNAPAIHDMAAHMLMVGFRDAEPGSQAPIAKQIVDGYTANVILFDVDVSGAGPARNIRSPEQLARLVAFLKNLPGTAAKHLWVTVDQEGGAVQRLKPERGFAARYPSAKELGKGSMENVRRTAEALGKELKHYGFDLNFAPVADLDINPDSPAIGRKERSFGPDPEAVFRCAMAYGNGLVDAGVVPCLKHFPGHGSADTDTHDGFTDITSSWSAIELEPYREAVRAGWPGAVMTAHVVNTKLDPALPASLSRKITTGLLRNELGWNGVVITDDLHMGAIAKQYGLKETILLAIEAGADILVFSNNSRDVPYDDELARKAHGIIVAAVENGEVTEERIRESWIRIMNLKNR